MRRTKPGLVVIVHFPLGHKLYEAVESFIKPAPLSLIAVDDHREIIVPYFVNDGRDRVDLGRFRIGAVWFGSTWIETNHWILHAVGCLN